VIEALRTSILVPHDHLHINQKRTYWKIGIAGYDASWPALRRIEPEAPEPPEGAGSLL